MRLRCFWPVSHFNFRGWAVVFLVSVVGFRVSGVGLRVGNETQLVGFWIIFQCQARFHLRDLRRRPYMQAVAGPEPRLQGLRFRVTGCGSRDSGLRFRVEG